MIVQRTNTILYCERWDATVAFYSDIFKFSITFQNDWFVEFKVADNSYLSIANQQRASINSVDGDGITLSWQVQDIRATYQYLAEQAIPIGDIKQKWGALTVFLHDPDGHRIELWQPIEEA